jgi:hypothetical protein
MGGREVGGLANQLAAHRVAAFSDGRLDGALFIGPAEAAPSWDAVRALFESEKIEDGQRRLLLSGKSGEGLAAAGPIVCACFGVGLAAIRAAPTSGGGKRRGNRQGLARRHELRLLSARIGKDCRR